jgi:hypothetical protein
MDVTLALLADAANTSSDDKLNVLGAFDRISASAFPAVHPQMTLVIRFEAGPAEWEQTKTVDVKLLDEDGVQMFGLSTNLHVPRGEPGEPVVLQNILNLAGVRFQRPGNHSFVIMVNGETKQSVRLRLALIDGPAPADHPKEESPQ